MSYSQYGEAEFVMSMFPADYKGAVMEVGAWDPKVFSNSRTFIEAGWRALLVEMSPGPLQKLIKEYCDHPAVTVMAACIGDGGLSEFRMSDDALSTNDSGVYNTWKDAGKDGPVYYGKSTYPLTPPYLLLEGRPDVSSYDVVSVDTEGSSLAVLDSLLGAMSRRSMCFPEVVIVEHDSHLYETFAVANKYGYQVVDHPPSAGTNAILRRKEEFRRVK